MWLIDSYLYYYVLLSSRSRGRPRRGVTPALLEIGNMQTIGRYTVTGDANSLEGWTGELLAVALRGPLGALGIEVEYYPNVSGGEGLTLADEGPATREQVQRIVEEVVVAGPAKIILSLSPLRADEPARVQDLPAPVRNWFLRTDHYTEDAEGYVYDPEQAARPEWGDVVEQYLWDLGIEP